MQNPASFSTFGSMKISYSLVLIIVALFCYCCNQPGKSNRFAHDIGDGATPWSYEPKGKSPADFTFAIISDLYSGERPGVFEVAVEQLNMLRPEFILSIGDLIDGGTEDVVELKKQFDHFDQRVAKAGAPFFHVGGNHDLTNPVMRKFWIERYGKRYYHFIYNNVLFLMMDSEDYNETRMQEIYLARAKAIEILDGDHPELYPETEYFKMEERKTGEISSEQSSYFEKVIADHPEVQWTFILMHKPVWRKEGEGNLARIENALAGKNYTVVNGHLHSYSHQVKNGHDYMTLGTTSGGQNPEDENAFDHVTLVSLSDGVPSIATLRMDGILDKTGKIPLDGEKYCYQASKCDETAAH